MKLRLPRRTPEKRDSSLSFQSWVNEYLNFNGVGYPFASAGSLAFKQEEITGDFTSVVQQMYKSNPVVHACVNVRMLLFSEARFQFRKMSGGRPGDLWGNPDLAILEKPWTNGTTGDLLARMMQDADHAGNFYARRVGKTLQRMRPDWVSIVLGSRTDQESAGWQLDAEVAGYMYHPGGIRSGQSPVLLLPEEVAHFAPIPDPFAHFRGMSWLSTVIREVMADSAASNHKLKFFENGATPNLFISLKEVNPEAFEAWQRIFKDEHQGAHNAYKTMFLGGGADATVIGADMKQLDFKVTQGAGETRIAAAAGVPPVIVGLSEGLAAATYSNYQLAMRRFCDLTMRPLWRNAAASLATVIKVPAGSVLWYDDRDIPALGEDGKARADIQQTEALTIHSLITSGYEPVSVIAAVTSNDFSKLAHTGMYSVQLLPAGTVAEGKGSVVSGQTAPADQSASANGHKEEALRV